MTLCPFDDQAGKDCIHRDDQGNCSGFCSRRYQAEAQERLEEKKKNVWTYDRLNPREDIGMKVWIDKAELQVYILQCPRGGDREEVLVSLPMNAVQSLFRWLEAHRENLIYPIGDTVVVR